MVNLRETLKKHKKWLNNEDGGERADMHRADMREADMRGANMREADMHEANMSGANMREANMSGADMSGADMCEVDMHRADMSGADMSGANVDYSDWPLWRGSLWVKVCKRIAAQLAYHFCCLDCNDPDYIKARNAVVPFANTFHRAVECGFLTPMEVTKDE